MTEYQQKPDIAALQKKKKHSFHGNTVWHNHWSQCENWYLHFFQHYCSFIGNHFLDIIFIATIRCSSTSLTQSNLSLGIVINPHSEISYQYQYWRNHKKCTFYVSLYWGMNNHWNGSKKRHLAPRLGGREGVKNLLRSSAMLGEEVIWSYFWRGVKGGHVRSEDFDEDRRGE